MKTKIRFVQLLSLLFLFCGSIIFADAGELRQLEPSLDFEVQMRYDSSKINESILKLVSDYPEWASAEIIGYSLDGTPIYSLVLTADSTVYRNNPQAFHTTRKHYLFEAGTHAREVVNPIVLLKVAESYLIDIETTDYLPALSVKSLLRESVLHFVVLTNPDGFDLSKFGASALSEQGGDKAISIMRTNHFSLLKSNLNGVDLNRNFVDTYYDKLQDKWIAIWSKKNNSFISRAPSLAYYFGAAPGSEPETKALTDYLSKYDFRSVISFHSRGNIIYWRYWMHDQSFNDENFKFAKIIHQATGYQIAGTGYSEASSGYLGDYVSNMLQKPSITIETLSSDENYHTSDKDIYNRVFLEVVNIPYLVASHGNQLGYYPYRLYQNDVYVRDFQNLEYASAIAGLEGGIIVTGDGQPTFRASDLITRKEFVEALIRTTVPSLESLEPHFSDCGSSFVTKAFEMGLITDSISGKFYPDRPITTEEALVILYRYDQMLGIRTDGPWLPLYNYASMWSYKAIQHALQMNYVDRLEVLPEKLTRTTYDRLLEAYIKKEAAN
ncbi:MULTISPECIES: M14 family zinc carboxypeptidase [unclassified Fusibacter]|uniref:M14 family zinc carboxypeptidase n=1 Tax=unclassified Fusibacter TaxID=2624464 RepID=UPI00101366F1|nr:MULTISPECIES: M14 family zinc carboxypeptidase [unclassified Fusibacter]MCK8060484.1 hypothetical protein [Fusibacter sp. A2]NPE20227.1 hypothetical protein [Fusibacter sp. A1]RXV63435.1 hypothetical protein DWB64_00245 [Fusibacter sp. A1]